MTFRKLLEPNGCPECYELHAYCDHENDEHDFEEFPHIFTGRNQREVKAQARKNGWRFHHNGTATCPKCMARKKRGDVPAGPFTLEGD